MSEGRKTKSGVHYNYVDRRKAALRSLKTGTAQAAREYGVSEGSIKSWRKMYGLDNETGYGGTMDRYFCQKCVHGCGNRSTFTGCSYLLHTGEKRPHKNGWCLGFEPREGVRQSTVERYEKETKRHEEESEDDHMDTAIEPKDIDKAIQDKANRHTQGIRYSKEEKLRVLEVYDVHNMIKTCDYFGIAPSTIRDWHKRRGEIKAMRPTKEEVAADVEETSAPAYRKLTPEDVPDVPDIEAAETEDAQTEPGGTWDDYLAEKLREHIRELERQLGRYRRMLDILEGN
jgi:transposase-like protein